MLEQKIYFLISKTEVYKTIHDGIKILEKNLKKTPLFLQVYKQTGALLIKRKIITAKKL